MDYKEEQLQELEVIESIYPDEFSCLDNEYPGIKFNVRINVEPQPFPDSSFTADSLSNDHYLDLQFSLPENYPDVAPKLEIECIEESRKDDDDEEDEDEEEIEYDENGNPIEAKLTNLPDQIHFQGYALRLTSQVEQQAEDEMLIGMQMCFAFVAWIKESCETWFQEELARLEREHERKLMAKEREEQKKFHGTKVTRETYLEWRNKFRKEMGLEERGEARKQVAHGGRLTGRQIFEQGLDGEEDLDDAGANV
ncbi:LAMI_0H17106g1_1 [Lachancea mirantina]|uniref:LAMI_0H17106g1_1 n=1 Tax=Lachancea mirantina TaxID=1230905 RepID=A0A1G4KJ23_9SACH|nr:LAMI_0H17106g1_1 [Lachancea mirantina]